MTRTFANRSAVGIISAALALGIAAPAGAATARDRATARPVAPARNSPGPATLIRCTPFTFRLVICAEPGDYGVPQAPKTANVSPTPTRIATHSNGFDWSNAGFGAAALVLIGIGVGGIRAATSSRARHAATS
jgi:hypothetical protein